jgi:hypothetical protein
MDIKEFSKALEEAYPSYNKLKQMVRFKLDENLESIAGSGILNDVVFNLVEWAESKGKLEHLIQGAYEGNQDNSALKEFYQKYCPFSNPVSVLSLEQWQEIQLILSEIDYNLLEQTCRETLKETVKNIEDNFPEIINLKSLRPLKEILLEKCPYKKEVPTVIEFAERLSKNAKVIETSRTEIKTWLEKLAKEKNIKLPSYTETQPSSITANSYLEIVIDKESEVSDNFILKAELIPNYREGDRQFHSEQLSLNADSVFIELSENIEDIIDVIVDATYEFIKIAKMKLIKEYITYNLTVELFLPTQYLGQYFDLKKIPAGRGESKEIGYQYQLVTRCLERYLINEDTNWGEFFTKFELRWNFFRDFLKNNPVETDLQDKFLYLENDQIIEIEQWDAFAQATEWEKSQKLAVTATGTLSKNECQQKFFECLLRGGIPLSLWHRCPQLNSLQVGEQFQNILKVDVLQDLNKLLKKVLEVRRDAHDKHQQIALGYHLGFLCEHGERIPSVLNPYQGGDLLIGSD